jgi:hypothetical protein
MSAVVGELAASDGSASYFFSAIRAIGCGAASGLDAERPLCSETQKSY